MNTATAATKPGDQDAPLGQLALLGQQVKAHQRAQHQSMAAPSLALSALVLTVST
jgi:hypothetical protein